MLKQPETPELFPKSYASLKAECDLVQLEIRRLYKKTEALVNRCVLLKAEMAHFGPLAPKVARESGPAQENAPTGTPARARAKKSASRVS